MNQTTEQDELRDYLLGKLSPERSAVVEQRLLSDGDYYEQLLIVEDELVDQYVAGRLEEAEIAAFRSAFLTTPERQQKVRFGQVFREFVNPQAMEPVPGSPSSWFHGRPLAIGGFVLLVLLGTFAVYRWRENRTETTSSTAIVVVTLTPGMTRGGGETQRISEPAANSSVQLVLRLRNTDSRHFRAELKREAVVIATSRILPREVQAEGAVVRMTVSGQTLSSGDYQVELSANSDASRFDLIDTYSFRVVK